MSELLAREKIYLKENQTGLAERYPGKFLLIKEETIHGAFETYEQGVFAGTELLGAGPFLVRSVLHPEDLEAPSIPALSVGISLVANP